MNKPWSEPGLSVEERVALLGREHNLQGTQGFAAGLVAEAMRQARADALEEAAKVAEDMAFDAIALRIRKLGDAP